MTGSEAGGGFSMAGTEPGLVVATGGRSGKGAAAGGGFADGVGSSPRNPSAAAMAAVISAISSDRSASTIRSRIALASVLRGLSTSRSWTARDREILNALVNVTSSGAAGAVSAAAYRVEANSSNRSLTVAEMMPASEAAAIKSSAAARCSPVDEDRGSIPQ